MGCLGELRDMFPARYNAVFRGVIYRIFGISLSRILSTLPSLTARAYGHISVQVMQGACECVGVNMSDDAWVIAFVGHLAR
jgi:hypothetical protein